MGRNFHRKGIVFRNFFTKRVVKQLRRLTKEVFEAPGLPVLKGIWTMPLTSHFNLVTPEVVRQLD